jgi:hypothetical protein
MAAFFGKQAQPTQALVRTMELAVGGYKNPVRRKEQTATGVHDAIVSLSRTLAACGFVKAWRDASKPTIANLTAANAQPQQQHHGVDTSRRTAHEEAEVLPGGLVACTSPNESSQASAVVPAATG